MSECLASTDVHDADKEAHFSLAPSRGLSYELHYRGVGQGEGEVVRGREKSGQGVRTEHIKGTGVLLSLGFLRRPTHELLGVLCPKIPSTDPQVPSAIHVPHSHTSTLKSHPRVHSQQLKE